MSVKLILIYYPVKLKSCDIAVQYLKTMGEFYEKMKKLNLINLKGKMEKKINYNLDFLIFLSLMRKMSLSLKMK